MPAPSGGAPAALCYIHSAFADALFRSRLKAGRRSLEPIMMVRIHPPEPPLLEVSFAVMFRFNNPLRVVLFALTAVVLCRSFALAGQTLTSPVATGEKTLRCVKQIAQTRLRKVHLMSFSPMCSIESVFEFSEPLCNKDMLFIHDALKKTSNKTWPNLNYCFVAWVDPKVPDFDPNNSCQLPSTPRIDPNAPTFVRAFTIAMGRPKQWASMLDWDGLKPNQITLTTLQPGDNCSLDFVQVVHDEPSFLRTIIRQLSERTCQD